MGAAELADLSRPPTFIRSSRQCLDKRQRSPRRRPLATAAVPTSHTLPLQWLLMDRQQPRRAAGALTVDVGARSLASIPKWH